MNHMMISNIIGNIGLLIFLTMDDLLSIGE